MNNWVNELERICALSQNAMREHAVEIPVTILYVNRKNELESTLHDNIILSKDDENKTMATREMLLKKMCQHKKTGVNSKYVCKELLLFHVSIEPEQMLHFANGGVSESHRFFRTFPVTDSIEIEPSIFVFHQINQLYFLFQEVVSLKSCLKKSSHDSTKRVRLLLKRQTRRKETV